MNFECEYKTVKREARTLRMSGDSKMRNILAREGVAAG